MLEIVRKYSENVRKYSNELGGGPKDFVLTTSGFTNLPGKNPARECVFSK